MADTELCFPVSLLAGDRPETWQLQRFVGVGGRPVRVVENVCADWEKLSLALQFHGGVIRAVERSQHFQVGAACLTILQKWLDGEGRQPVTWETLIGCLEGIGHSTLASDLRRELECEHIFCVWVWSLVAEWFALWALNQRLGGLAPVLA